MRDVDVRTPKSREPNSEIYAMRAVMQQGSNRQHGHEKVTFFFFLLSTAVYCGK